MTEQKIPDRGVWMSPGGVHLVVETDDGELDGLEHNADAGWLLVGMYDQVPDEFVQLVPAPPTPRVFLPGDTVAAGTEVWTKDRNVYRWGADRQLQPYEGPMVEVLYPSPEEWQAAVDRAAERANTEQHTEGTNQ